MRIRANDTMHLASDRAMTFNIDFSPTSDRPNRIAAICGEHVFYGDDNVREIIPRIFEIFCPGQVPTEQTAFNVADAISCEGAYGNLNVTFDPRMDGLLDVRMPAITQPDAVVAGLLYSKEYFDSNIMSLLVSDTMVYRPNKWYIVTALLRNGAEQRSTTEHNIDFDNAFTFLFKRLTGNIPGPHSISAASAATVRLLRFSAFSYSARVIPIEVTEMGALEITICVGKDSENITIHNIEQDIEAIL